MRCSTLLAVLVSWTVYLVVGMLEVRRAESTPTLNAGRFVAVLVTGKVALVLIHSWVAAETGTADRTAAGALRRT